MITILSGSARHNANTLRVAKAAQQEINNANISAEIIDFKDFDIPNYNQRFDPANLSTWQQGALDSILKSKLVIFISPEYNWMPTAEMIQFINRFSGNGLNHIWDNRTFATIGLSSGIGGRLPALHLKNMIDEVIGYSKSSGKTVSAIQEVNYVMDVIDIDGNLLENELFNQSFSGFIKSLCALV
jgi:chromate reductase